MSARLSDMNGFTEIKGNPISKVGIFPYSGKQISPDLEPDKIYMVYRSQAELEHPDCIASFKLLPLVDDHAMLGKEADGLLPAEQKGVHGVIGENVYFEDIYLKGNLRLFSEAMGDLIEAGKKELSAGYRCEYVIEPGEFNGEPYDIQQRSIRGNHLALVQEGRMGPDVAVLDHLTFTLDAKELNIMTPEEMKAALAEALAPVIARLEKLETKAPAEDEEKAAKQKTADEAAAAAAKEKPAADAEGDDKPMTAADGAEILKQLKVAQDTVADLTKNGEKAFLVKAAARDALAEQLSHHIGAFDAKEKTLDEVAAYGCDKLELKPEKGTELATLKGFLHNREKPSAEVSTAADGKLEDASPVAAFLKHKN